MIQAEPETGHTRGRQNQLLQGRPILGSQQRTQDPRPVPLLAGRLQQHPSHRGPHATDENTGSHSIRGERPQVL